MVYTACLPVCGMSVADTLVRGTPVLGVAGVLPSTVGRALDLVPRGCDRLFGWSLATPGLYALTLNLELRGLCAIL